MYFYMLIEKLKLFPHMQTQNIQCHFQNRPESKTGYIISGLIFEISILEELLTTANQIVKECFREDRQIKII